MCSEGRQSSGTTHDTVTATAVLAVDVASSSAFSPKRLQHNGCTAQLALGAAGIGHGLVGLGLAPACAGWFSPLGQYTFPMPCIATGRAAHGGRPIRSCVSDEYRGNARRLANTGLDLLDELVTSRFMQSDAAPSRLCTDEARDHCHCSLRFNVRTAGCFPSHQLIDAPDFWCPNGETDGKDERSALLA